MKQRSCMASSVCESDDFLSLPLSAQALYFHLQVYADSMGLLDSLEIPRRACGASADDLQALFSDGWILDVDGVPVIRDWLVSNRVQDKDVHTRHPETLAKLEVSKGKPYRLKRGAASRSQRQTAGKPWADLRPTLGRQQASLTKKENTNERIFYSETAAPAGAGGGSAEICPECGDFLTSGRCFSCNFTAPRDTGGGGE